MLGFEDAPVGLTEAPNRPGTMADYNQDLVNGIVHNYCDPPFHCAVYSIPGPGGAKYPVVKIPGGHRVPVRAARSGPHGRIVDVHAIYVRKPGPRSETPTSSQEWDSLLARCQGNRGGVPQPDDGDSPLELWTSNCFDRWCELTKELPEEAGPRCLHGHYSLAYEIVGDVRQITLTQLPEIIRSSAVFHTGYPPFWYPPEREFEPYVADDALECWLGRCYDIRKDELKPADAEFWRIDTSGRAYLLRGYQEDSGDPQRAGLGNVRLGTVFDVVLPVLRVGETLLQAERLADGLFKGQTKIRFVANYKGLQDRALVSLDPRRYIRERGVSRQDSIRLETTVRAKAIGPNLPEIVHSFLRRLYTLFGLFELSPEFVATELATMRKRSL